ncbi:MAG: hypothetical protein AVDCRST_MAG53-1660 [uncultured Solirubrobacteraceae bacterium]|uniref:Asl1-like glycosyl hydrolase catalytic domain-containing protein n=1 Tax=uncultured Solirubrobacteraceae bacterium TaxID=1162706 RepID=A0A6J4S9I6_9ACTN|nr:MAG: hypothetical protein AVDCRST_MAG53-1660 [uncultured Solirubrobacteraceae bacterium]
MRRLVVTALLSVLAVAAVPSGASAATFGISDQQASTFINPLYKPLKLKIARYVAPYDVVFDATQAQRFNAWYRAAIVARQRMLVSFEHSRTAGKEQTLPTKAQFKIAMKAFKQAFPRVKEINTWNEVNRCQTGGRTEGQPKGICKGLKGARLLNTYYGVTRSVFKGSKIIPLNVLDERNPAPAIKYVKLFKRIAKPRPKIWAIHNYSDTNRLSQSRTKRIIKTIGKGDIWLLETGGQLKLGRSTPGEAKAAKALKCMFKIAKNKRIKRAYIYQFNGAAPDADFDAGLIGFDGVTKRAGYEVVRKRTSKGGC